MITKTAPLRAGTAFPLGKGDIQYDPSREEVAVPRKKFDAFIKYVQGLEQKLEAAEDARDVALYRAQKAGKTADVLTMLLQDVNKASAAVREWLKAPGHSLLELSERSGISYATCHRIVKERLGTEKIEVGHLKKMVAAVARSVSLPVASVSREVPLFKRVLFGLPKGFQEEEELVSGWQTQGSKVETVHLATDIARKAHELDPDLILVDLSMPNLGKSGFDELKQFAKDKQTTVVLTGKITEANSALVEGSFEASQTVQQAGTRGSKSAGG